MQIPRSVTRLVRRVFRPLIRKSERVSAPLVAFQAASDGLHIQLHYGDVAAEYMHSGDYPAETIGLPWDKLADFEGRDGEVTLQTIAAGKVQARWNNDCVPQLLEYEGQEVPDFPQTPDDMGVNDSGLLKALADASASAAKEGVRFAMHHLQLAGKTGEITATDGRQLLVQRGYHFPWTEDVLIPGSAVFHSRELAIEADVSIGKTDSHVICRTGPWTLALPIDKEGRYPKVAEIIPSPESACTHCRLDIEDAIFLGKALPRLPGHDEDVALVTVDLNGEVIIRAKAVNQSRATELVLARSTVQGKPIRFHGNRDFLARALALGFTDLELIDGDKPICCRDDRRIFVWMPLSKEAAFPPHKDNLRLVSVEPANSSPSTLSIERTTSMAIAQTNGTANGHRSVSSASETTSQRQAKGASINTLIEEAEALRTTLREAHGRANQLINAIKRHRQQSKWMATTLASLRQIQQVDA